MGRLPSPWDFPPHELAGKGRFDGPPAAFRTLYCSGSALTSLRETMAFLRPSLKALQGLAKMEPGTFPALPNSWRQRRVLASAKVEILSGEVLPLDDMILHRDLRLKLSDLLLDLGVEHLDMDEIQGKRRELTQAIARMLFDEGAAGILYRSKYDNELCGALFEGRVRLLPHGLPRSLADPVPELEQVCEEFLLDPLVGV